MSLPERPSDEALVPPEIVAVPLDGRRRWLRALWGGVTLGIFLVAPWALHQALRGYTLEDVLRAFEGIPPRTLGLTLALTALGYVALTGYDTLALRFAGHPLPYRRTAFASFVSYTFSHNTGLGGMVGHAFRFRYYTMWGVKPKEIGKVVAFTSLTFWLGFFLLGGLLFLTELPNLPKDSPFPVHHIRPLGLLFTLMVLTYFLGSALRRDGFRIGTVHIPTPGLRLSVVQTGVALADWALVAATMYVLLPPHAEIPFLRFLAAYIVAQFWGTVSHAPAGVGVFDAAMVYLLRPLTPPEVLGALLAYRVVYNLIPLAAAGVAIALYETKRKIQGRPPRASE